MRRRSLPWEIGRRIGARFGANPDYRRRAVHRRRPEAALRIRGPPGACRGERPRRADRLPRLPARRHPARRQAPEDGRNRGPAEDSGGGPGRGRGHDLRPRHDRDRRPGDPRGCLRLSGEAARHQSPPGHPQECARVSGALRESREARARDRGPARHGRPFACDWARAREGRARGRHRRAGPDYGRERHRQGADGPCAPTAARPGSPAPS